MTVEQLRKLQSEDPSLEDRVDISTVKIDANTPTHQRAEQYLAQIKNPYAFQCAGIAVNLEFCHDGLSLRETVKSYLTACKNSS